VCLKDLLGRLEDKKQKRGKKSETSVHQSNFFAILRMCQARAVLQKWIESGVAKYIRNRRGPTELLCS